MTSGLSAASLCVVVERHDLAGMQRALPNAPAHQKRMALVACAVQGFVDGVGMLMEHASEQDIQDALRQATHNNHTGVIKLLLDRIDPAEDQTDNLASAAANQNPHAVALFLPRADANRAASDLLDDGLDVELLAARLSPDLLRRAITELPAHLAQPQVRAHLAALELNEHTPVAPAPVKPARF